MVMAPGGGERDRGLAVARQAAIADYRTLPSFHACSSLS